MRTLLCVAVAALGVAGIAPLRADPLLPPATSAEAPAPKTLDHAKRIWFQQAVDDILTDRAREADRGEILQGRSSNR